jgi:Kef-type K+ transport system membrane component KefB
VHALSELGVVVLLFEIGLETELGALRRVGGVAAMVAAVGVVTPFALGLLATRALGLALLPSVVASAALTATSVGITARVLADLGYLKQPEGQVVLGAAVFDDVIGLIVLAVVSGLVAGGSIDAGAVARTTAIALLFLVVSIVAGRVLARPLFALLGRVGKEGTLAVMGFAFALLFAVSADRAGLAPLVGAFAAGLLVGETPQAAQIRSGIVRLGHLLVPIFFVAVGAAVDVRAFAQVHVLVLGLVLVAVGVAGKIVAGYGPWWFRGRKLLIGVAMIPRGEVGLIFARMGLASGVLDAGMYAAILLMVIVTTLGMPPALRAIVKRGPEPPRDAGGVAELASEI